MSTTAPAPPPSAPQEAEAAAPPPPTADAADAADDAGGEPAVVEGTIGEVLTLPSLCMECFKNVSRRVWGEGEGVGRRTQEGGARARRQCG